MLVLGTIALQLPNLFIFLSIFFFVSIICVSWTEFAKPLFFFLIISLATLHLSKCEHNEN